MVRRSAIRRSPRSPTAKGRVVVTKDDEFRVLHLTRRQPAHILIFTCGNNSTADLIGLVEQNHADLAVAVEQHDALAFLASAGVETTEVAREDRS